MAVVARGVGGETEEGDVRKQSLEQWADFIIGVGEGLFPEWEWLPFTTDAYQDFMRDWEGCAVKARRVEESTEFQCRVEKHGVIFEFNERELEDLQELPVRAQEQALAWILTDGVSNWAPLVAPGETYPTYPYGYYEFLERVKG